jgi:hypothetical protein
MAMLNNQMVKIKKDIMWLKQCHNLSICEWLVNIRPIYLWWWLGDGANGIVLTTLTEYTWNHHPLLENQLFQPFNRTCAQAITGLHGSVGVAAKDAPWPGSRQAHWESNQVYAYSIYTIINIYTIISLYLYLFTYIYIFFLQVAHSCCTS